MQEPPAQDLACEVLGRGGVQTCSSCSHVVSSGGIAGGGVAAGRSAAGAPRGGARAPPQGDPAAPPPGAVRRMLSQDAQPLCCFICSCGTGALKCLSRMGVETRC